MHFICVISHAVNSRSSSSSKYDPEILKAEIVTAKSRVRNSSIRPLHEFFVRAHDG